MATFDLFFMGGEQAGWRRLLSECGVPNLGISYWSWKKRRKNLDSIDIDQFGFDQVLLDSGGFSANKNPTQLTVGEWKKYGEDYVQFALDHIDELALVTEFDAQVLGADWIRTMRAEAWSQIDPEKFMPIWHPEHGLPALEELGENYKRIGITEAAMKAQGLNITPQLNALVRKGVQLHGVAMTKPTTLKQVQFSTAASTSWLSPNQYGDTIVWVNNDLKRYPERMKDQARMRHRALFEDEGFNVDKIAADDKTELLRLAVWSWLEQEKAIQALRTNWLEDRSNYAEWEGETPKTQTGTAAVGTKRSGDDNAQMPRPPLLVRAESALVPLPMFGTTQLDMAADTATGEITQIELLEVRGNSARRCDSCVIRDKCPEAKANTTCAYSIPTAIKTPEQRKAFLTGMIEMQAQRVQFGYLVEQMNGGYADPNLSQEYDRLLKAMQVQADLEDTRDFLKISVEARGKSGALTRLFGAAPSRQTIIPRDEQETDAIASRIIEGKRVV